MEVQPFLCPRTSPDGRELFYRRGSNNHPMYDVFPIGRKFLMLQEEESNPSKLFVVTNWMEELRRRLRSR